MFSTQALKEAHLGAKFNHASGFNLPDAEVEYEITSITDKDGKLHVGMIGRLFGVDFCKVDAIVKGNSLNMHSVIL